MAVGVIQYQKPQEEQEDKSFLNQISKPVNLAANVASIASAFKKEPKPQDTTEPTDNSSAIERRLGAGPNKQFLKR